MPPRLLSYIKVLFRRGRTEDDLSEELQFHLQKQIEKNIAAGMKSDEARYAALRSFGGMDQVTEECRDLRGVRAMNELLQDLRYALRLGRRNPGFTTVVVLTLALGIGANTAVFSVINAVLFRPLPFPDAQRLMAVQSSNLERKEGYFSAPGVFLDWRERSTSFESLTGVRQTEMALSRLAQARFVSILACSFDFPNVIGVRPILGRTFTKEEDQVGRANVALIDAGFWQRQLGGVPDVLGKTLTLNDSPYTIVGVLPPDIRFGNRRNEVWIPIAADRRHRAGGDVLAVGHLRAGVSQASAQAEMDRIMQGIRQEQQQDSRTGVLVRPLHEWVTGEVRRPFLALLAAVAFVLMICCANVANLMIARATTRQREMAIRAALGAGRLRLARQTFVESLLLSAAGGVLGLLMAIALIQAVPSIEAFYIPRVDEIALDRTLLAVAFLSSLITGLFSGIAPALLVRRRELRIALQSSGQDVFGRAGGKVWRNVLAAAQLALALTLLVGAGLMTNTLIRLMNIDLGFDRFRTLIVRATTPYPKYDRAKTIRFYQELMAEVSRMPGIASVSAADYTPLEAVLFPIEVQASGGTTTQKYEALARRIAPQYFHTLGIPLLAGRDLKSGDERQQPVAVLINKRMGRLLFGEEDPIGKQLSTRYRGMEVLEVVGIAGDVRQLGLRVEPGLQLYLPMLAAYASPSCLVAKTLPQAGDLTAAIRSAVRSLDPEVPVPEIMTMDAMFSRQVAQPRFYLGVLGAFAATGLILAAIGIYGVMSYMVLRRTQEFGIRMALGARETDILSLVLGKATFLIAGGVIAGLAGALVLNRLLSSLLYGVQPNDPLTLGCVSVLLCLVALLASYLPARRAAKTDPMVSLRYE